MPKIKCYPVSLHLAQRISASTLKCKPLTPLSWRNELMRDPENESRIPGNSLSCRWAMFWGGNWNNILICLCANKLRHPCSPRTRFLKHGSRLSNGFRSLSSHRWYRNHSLVYLTCPCSPWKRVGFWSTLFHGASAERWSSLGFQRKRQAAYHVHAICTPELLLFDVMDVLQVG